MRKFLAPPYYSQRAVFASPLSAFFIQILNEHVNHYLIFRNFRRTRVR